MVNTIHLKELYLNGNPIHFEDAQIIVTEEGYSKSWELWVSGHYFELSVSKTNKLDMVSVDGKKYEGVAVTDSPNTLLGDGKLIELDN
ncbi:hypothetical protein J27TS7_10810 [Paenibacillus dendritiformis]|uniref:hypothetical protein n=1 Tax=Paenibacillus dendritiformis TaxID=130049 RepID=UPI001B2754E7|nr:hypothetical protein [Paenibacillus dendritiformis]GIO71567.1 hypothetical protein J27TS7_10810 [Paenibacillus dendritiformis]